MVNEAFLTNNNFVFTNNFIIYLPSKKKSINVVCNVRETIKDCCFIKLPVLVVVIKNTFFKLITCCLKKEENIFYGIFLCTYIISLSIYCPLLTVCQIVRRYKMNCLPFTFAINSIYKPLTYPYGLLCNSYF